MDNESILEIISKNIKSTEVDDKLKICDFRKLLYKELHRDFSYKYAELIRKLFAIEVKNAKLFVVMIQTLQEKLIILMIAHFL